MLAGLIDGGIEQPAADPAAAPGSDHRHPPDLAGAEQPCTAKRLAGLVDGEKVGGLGVQAIPLKFLRHALFLDEHGIPDLVELVAM